MDVSSRFGSVACAAGNGVRDLWAYERDKRIGVAKHHLPAILFAPEYVRGAIQKRHEIRAAIQSCFMVLDSDGACQVAVCPATDLLVCALAAGTLSTIPRGRLLEASREWFPATDVASIRAQQNHVIAATEELSPEAPIPTRHAAISSVESAEHNAQIKVSRKLIHGLLLLSRWDAVSVVADSSKHHEASPHFERKSKAFLDFRERSMRA